MPFKNNDKLLTADFLGLFQSVVCDDLDIPKYSMFSVSTKKDLKIKDRADLLEAFIGALYVDKDLVKLLSRSAIFGHLTPQSREENCRCGHVKL